MAGVLRIVGLSTLFFVSFVPCIYGEDEIYIPREPNQVLTEDNWRQVLQGEWMVKFFAPWCPACRHVAQTWIDFASKSNELGINVGEVDVTKQSALSGRFMISALPTIYHIKDGVFRKYGGGRSLQDFTSFIEEEKWKDVESLPSWKTPGSFLMGVLGVLFKISMVFKSVHDLLTEYYGLPAWASYTIFGVSTIAVGLLLGLVIVLVTDKIFGTPEEQTPVPCPLSTEEQEPEDKRAEMGREEDEDEEVVDDPSSSDGSDSTVRKRVVTSKED